MQTWFFTEGAKKGKKKGEWHFIKLIVTEINSISLTTRGFFNESCALYFSYIPLE